MTNTTPPSKQLVRDYMDSRTQSDDPPPSTDEIRRQMGWFMLPHNRQPDADDKD